VTEE